MDDFSLWDVLVSMFWFMLLFAWIWLLISILSDIFRDRELGGGAKAMWTLFLIFLPWLGALVYLIARGTGMQKRAMEQATEMRKQQEEYIRATAGTGGGSATDDIAKAKSLLDSGAISQAEFDALKAKALAG